MKQEDGKLSLLKAVYIEANNLCFVFHDDSVVKKEYPSTEVVKYKLSNVESYIANKGQLIDLGYL